MKDLLHQLKSDCLNNKIEYNLIDTTIPFDKALFSYFKKRARGTDKECRQSFVKNDYSVNDPAWDRHEQLVEVCYGDVWLAQIS